MEVLVKEMSQRALPLKRIDELLKLHVNKHKGKNLPWTNIARLLSKEVVESKSGFLFQNIRKLCKIKLSETVNQGLKLPKKSCQKYRDMLSRLQTEMHYNFEDTDVPLADLNQLSSHFLAAIIDLNTPALMQGCEAEAVSRIYIRITLIMGSSPDLILDTLLQCKTLIYSSIRNPVIFIPLIKRVFNTFKVQTSLTPKLYLKFLLLGKLWLFMEEKSKLPSTRMYIIKSLPVPQSFKEWACQNNLDWLKENDVTTKNILKRMTVSATLNILQGKRIAKQPQELTCDKTMKEMNNKKTKNIIVQEKETITSEHSEVKAETTGNNDGKKKKTKRKKRKKNKKKKVNADKEKDDSTSRKENVEMTKMDEAKEQENVKPGKSVLKQREREGDDELPGNTKKLKVQSVQKLVEKREEASHEEMPDSFSEERLNNQKRKNLEENTPVLAKVKKVAAKSGEELRENDTEVLDKNKKTKRKLETVVDEAKERFDNKRKNDTMLKCASEKIRTDKYVKAVQKLADTRLKGKEAGPSDESRVAESQIHKGRVNIVKKNQQVTSRSEELNSMGEEIEEAVHNMVEKKEVKTPEARKKLCLVKEVTPDGQNKKLKTSPVVRLHDKSQERKQLGSSPLSGRSEECVTSPREKLTLTREDIIEVRQRIRRNSVSFTVTDLLLNDVTPNKGKSPNQGTNKICSRTVQSPSGMTFEVFDMDDDDDHQSVDSDDASSGRASSEEPGEESNVNEEVEENDTSDIIEVSETDSVVAVTQTPKKDHVVNDKTNEIGNTSTGKELDSELEIVEVIQNKEPIASQKDEGVLEESSDIDEASGSDSDIIPCDETAKMFTDEENKHYHDKLIAQELKRKAENIVEMDKLEFQRKKTQENGHHVRNGDDARNPNADERNCEVVNVDCSSNSHFEEKQGSEQELESDGDMEILLQTIARDTGRIASVSGFKENLVPKENIQDRLEETNVKECAVKEKEADLASENKKLSNGPLSTNESTDGNHANHVKDLDSRKVNGIDALAKSPILFENDMASTAVIENKKDEDTNHRPENEVPSENDKEIDINGENIKSKSQGNSIEVENNSAANDSFRSESPDVEPLRLDSESPEKQIVSLDNENSQSVKNTLGTPVPSPLKDSVPVDSVEEDSESTEGADEAYEASSDASEDPMPKVRKRTRSLRRNLISHSVLQDASDSDVSPIRNRRSRMTSEVTSTAGKESPHRQRTRSSCSEVTGPCPDTLETGRLESAPSDMVNDINVKSLSEVVCDVHQNISECDSLCSLETMQDSTGTHITSEDTSFFLNDVKGSHSISSSATPIVSASGTPIKNITDSVSSPITRRSSRLLASEVLEKSKTRRQSLPSGALSDAAVTTKSLATRVLTRNARRKSFSDTEVHSQQAHQQKLDVTGSPKVTEKIESNIAEIMKDTDGELDSDNLSLGLDGNFSSSSLSCSLLQIEEEPLAECDNNNEKQIQAVVNDLRIYDINADATSESQTQEKEQKVVLANQVNASAEHLQEGTDATESDIMCRASDSENQVKLGETESMEVICDQLIKGGALEDHHEVEACLPEDVDEELEVLSTSGVDDTEDLSYVLSSSFTLNKDEDSENPETQMTTPKSFTRLRSLSQRRSGGKGSKKDDRVNDLKFDSPHLSSPKVKAQLVSEAVLNKEVLISPEVSDEECELVSPGGDETDLPKDNFTLSGGSDPLTPVNRRNKRRSGGGIRSPQKMIPEEQDETTTHIASVRGSPASKTLRIQKTKMFSTKSPKIVAENSEGSADITVSEQQKSANTETENKKPSVKSALEEPLEEIISNKAPILETPATTPSPRRNSGKGSQAAPDVDAESDTSVVKESSEVASVSKQETDLNLDSENKFSPVKTRRNRRSSLAIMTTEVKLTDNDKISKIKYCSPEQQNENAEKNSKEDSTPVYRTRRSMTLKKQDLKQELLSAPFSPRRSSRRKSVASNSSESTGSIEVVPLRSRRSSTASSSEDKHPQIPEEPACPKKSALKNAPVGLASPRTKSDRTSLLKSDPMGKCSPRNSSPARATRSSSGYTEAPTNLPAKSGTPVRTSSRLASRKESHTDSSCENGSSSETSSKGGNTGRSSLKKMSSDVPSTSSDMAAGQLNVSAKVDSELLTASVTEIKSPTRSSTFKSSQDKKVASSSSGNESPARSLSPSVSKTPVRSASLPLVTKTPTRSSPLNSANKALSSPTNKRSLRSPSVNKTPVRSPMTNTPARSPGRPPSVNKSLMRSPAANTISVKSPSSIKSPLTSPTVSKTQVTLASASETSMTSPIRVSRRSLSSDRSPLASPSVSRTHTRSSSISKSPGRPPAEKGLPKHSPKKSSSPFRAADSNSKGSAKDAEPVMTTRSLRHRRVTYSLS